MRLSHKMPHSCKPSFLSRESLWHVFSGKVRASVRGVPMLGGSVVSESTQAPSAMRSSPHFAAAATVVSASHYKSEACFQQRRTEVITDRKLPSTFFPSLSHASTDCADHHTSILLGLHWTRDNSYHLTIHQPDSYTDHCVCFMLRKPCYTPHAAKRTDRYVRDSGANK